MKKKVVTCVICDVCGKTRNPAEAYGWYSVSKGRDHIGNPSTRDLGEKLWRVAVCETCKHQLGQFCATLARHSLKPGKVLKDLRAVHEAAEDNIPF